MPTERVESQARHHGPGHDDEEVVRLGGDLRRRTEQRQELRGSVRERGGDHPEGEREHHAVPQDRRGGFLDAGAVVLRLIDGDGPDDPDAEDVRDVVEVRSQS